MYEVKTLTDLPDASKEAIDFIQGLSPHKTLALTGNDDLQFKSTSNSDDSKIGDYSITIGTANVLNSPVIKVTQKVNFKHKNIDRSRLLVCNVTPTLQLVELHFESHIHAKYHLSKEVNVVYDGEKMIVNFEYVIDGRQQSFANYEIMEDKIQEFLFPGQRYIMLKLFAMRGSVPSNLNFIELDNSNDFVISDYTDLGKWKVNYDGSWIEAMGIERKLHNKNYIQVARYFFDDTGNLLLRIEPGADIFIIHPSLKNFDSLKHFFIDEEKAKMKFDWEKDIEMRSIHACIKERIKSDLSKYIYRKPEWKTLMADFLQQILMDKPEHVVEYAVDYFTGNS